MAENKKYVNLDGLSYVVRRINSTKANIESPDFSGTPTIEGKEIATTEFVDTFLENLDPDTIGNALLAKKANIDSPEFTGVPTVPTAAKNDSSTQIANTKFVKDNYIGKEGDATINGKLTVLGNSYPLLTLKSTAPTSSGGYLMNIQGNLMFGDCTSNNASRQYYGRMVPALNQAIVGAVSIGYNPRDNANYSKSKDYGIKFDVDVAGTSSPTPSIIRQSGSFFVGVEGAYVGYSGSTSKPIDYDTQVYRVLDSNSIKTDEYIASLEQRIAALEAKLAALEESTN